MQLIIVLLIPDNVGIKYIDKYPSLFVYLISALRYKICTKNDDAKK